jgi:DNA-binding NarL/FixJ family response regulator
MKADAAIRVLIADDHAIFRQGLRLVLDGLDPPPDVVEAGDFAEARTLADTEPAPDLMLVDLRMPGMDGFAGIGALKRARPAAPLVVLSASEDSEDVFKALAAGASGYLPKSATAATILVALRLVLAGGVHVPRELVAGGAALGAPPPSAAAAPRLTARQAEVLDLIAGGHANKEIAHRLGTSEGTIKAHVAAIMRQYGVRNRVQLLLAAERAGSR